MMIRSEMKNYNMIVTEKQQKYQHSSGKIDKYILQRKTYYLSY